LIVNYQDPKPIRIEPMAEAGPLAQAMDAAVDLSFRTAEAECR